MGQGFYFEAMLITYAVLEDRMRSFLYHIGALRRANDKNLNVGKTKGFLRALYFQSENNANKRLDINQFSAKVKLIRATLAWAQQADFMTDEPYPTVLRSTYEQCLDMEQFLRILAEMEAWSGYRNEIIHGLLNKNYSSVNTQLREQVEAGMGYARFIDGQIKLLKKKNTIRHTMRIRD
jgi:hypothetical protein